MASWSDGDDFYDAHFGELVAIATKAKVPLAVAEQLAYEALVLAIFDRDELSDPHTWVVRAMTCAARDYNEINRVAEQLVNSVYDDWVP